MRLIIVKRGAFATFRIFRDRCATLPDVEVSWDRRWGEDRRRQTDSVPADRRRQDRRGPASATWTLMGYLVVDSADQQQVR